MHAFKCTVIVGALTGAVVLGAASSAAAASATISAVANGSTQPGLVPPDQTIQNGDFLIGANLLAPSTGDGTDETTTWTFHFATDPNYAAFQGAGGPITSAKLTLTLTTAWDPGPITDLVRPNDLFPIIPIPEFLSGPGYKTGTIDFELLNEGYSSGQLLTFLQSNAGDFPMIYADDAIVSYARLDLTAVPEPACMLLLTSGAVLAGYRRRGIA